MPHMYVRTYISFYVLSYVVCFIYRILTLSSFKKDAFVRNGYFSPRRSISIAMKQAFFYFKLLFRTKVSQNAFNSNQIESYVYSIF